MRIPLLLGLIAAIAAASAPGVGPARGQTFAVDLSQCRDQLEAFARTDLDCAVAVRPSEAGLERVPDMLRGLLSGLSCRAQVTAEKAAVYGQWITDGRFDPPAQRIACRHAEMQAEELVAAVDVTCTRAEGTWNCPPGVEKIEGAGALGQILAQYLNQDAGLWRALEEELAKRDE
jgi:hypothetical protein